MIPEGKILKAATFEFKNENVRMFGLGSTMPDPNMMGEKHPALADGTYSYANSLHNPLGINSRPTYGALRLFDSLPLSWNSVTGAKGNKTITGFPYGTGSWSEKRESFPAYYYDTNGKIIQTITNAINGHRSNENPFVLSSGYIGGSEGCLLWHTNTYYQVRKDWKFVENPIYGYIAIDRKLFGDGTNGTNKWKNWKDK